MVERKAFFVVFLISLYFNSASQLQFSFETAGSQNTAKEPVNISISRDSSAGRDTLSLRLTLRMEKNIHIYSSESLFFRVSISEKSGLGDGTINLPEPRSFVNFDKTTASVYIDGQEIVIRYPIIDAQWFLSGSLRFQACDSSMCFLPKEIPFYAGSDGTVAAGEAARRPTLPSSSQSGLDFLDGFSTIGSRSGYINPAAFADFLRNPSGNDGGTGPQTFMGKSIWAIFLFILLGGVALNLTPCVLPMIPITLAVIGAGAQAKSRVKGVIAGSVYGAAIALTYGVLGLVVVLTGSRFGVINSSPFFNLIISIILVIMALAMFDIIQVDFTRFRRVNSRSSERFDIAAVFLMGVIVSLMAGACVAPVVISVILYAGALYAKGNIYGLTMPFILGIGMALPWPFAAAGLSFLPKPGKWMVWVKYGLGIFILAMALYYGYTGIALFKSVNSPAVASTEAAHPSSLQWLTSLEEGALKSKLENKPLFIDFWATWCKNCKAMDANTLRHPEVKKLLQNYVIVKYQAEKPREPETKEILDRFGVVGLPTYIVAVPDGSVNNRSISDD